MAFTDQLRTAPGGPGAREEVPIDRGLLFGWAHDCNSAHTLVLGHLAQLEEAGPFLPRQHTLLQGLRKAVEYATQLPRQLLALARGAVPGGQLLDLRDLVRDMEGLVRGRCPAATRLVVQVGDEPALIAGEPQQLTRVLLNLVSNALEAMPYGGELVLRVERSPGDGPPAFDLQVRDTGPGIPAEVLPRLFQPLVSTRTHSGGTGLGLYVAMRIVEQHGGSIRCESRPGEGTRFTVTLPAARAGAGPATADITQSLVMVIERDPDVRRLACTILELARWDYREYATLEEARAGAEAIAGQGKVLLLDRSACRSENARALQELLSLVPDAGVVLTSTDRGSAHLVDASRLRSILPKPFSATELIAAIRAALAPA